MKIGIISDVHEDYIRLEQSIRILEREKVDVIACAGDIVGYSIPFYGYLSSRDANKCIELIRSVSCAVVAGNHDLYSVKRVPELCRGFDFPRNWYDLPFHERKKLSSGVVYLYEDSELSPLLSDESLEYLNNLPLECIVEADSTRILVSHYAFPDISGSSSFELSQCSDAQLHLDYMSRQDVQIGFSGNDHIAGAKIFTRDTVLESGFGTSCLDDGSCWITGPAVAAGTTANGIMTYDTRDHLLNVIPLNSNIHKIPNCI